jgi:hypothetical protein
MNDIHLLEIYGVNLMMFTFDNAQVVMISLLTI